MAQALLPVLFLLVVIPSESASADKPRDLLLLLVAPPSRRLRGTGTPACAFLSRCHPERVRFCGRVQGSAFASCSAAFQAASVAQALLPVLFLIVVIPSESASADESRDRLLLLVAPPSRRPPWHRHSCLCFS